MTGLVENIANRALGGWVVVAALAFPCGAARAAAQTPNSGQQVDTSWLNSDPTSKTAEFQLIAGLTGLNGALNFNGFRDGGLTLTVPKGWHVVIDFRNNDGMLPHSAEVIADRGEVPPEPVEPAFGQAFTFRLSQGIPPQGTDTMRFAADKAGSYLIFCAVPGHGKQGMWIRMVVAAKARSATLAATPGVRAR